MLSFCCESPISFRIFQEYNNQNISDQIHVPVASCLDYHIAYKNLRMEVLKLIEVIKLIMKEAIWLMTIPGAKYRHFLLASLLGVGSSQDGALLIDGDADDNGIADGVFDVLAVVAKPRRIAASLNKKHPYRNQYLPHLHPHD
jgi:hypothetical protein